MKILIGFFLAMALMSCESPNSSKKNLPAVEKTTITTQWFPQKYKLDEWENKKIECMNQIRKVIERYGRNKNVLVEFDYNGIMYLERNEKLYQCVDGNGTVVLTYNENTTRLLKIHPKERL